MKIETKLVREEHFSEIMNFIQNLVKKHPLKEGNSFFILSASLQLRDKEATIFDVIELRADTSLEDIYEDIVSGVYCFDGPELNPFVEAYLFFEEESGVDLGGKLTQYLMPCKKENGYVYDQSLAKRIQAVHIARILNEEEKG